MAKKPEIVSLPRDARARDAGRQSTSMSLPLAIYRRLDMLAEAAEGVEASRADIVAMLIAFADLDGDRLERQIIDYRKLTVGQVLPDGPDEPDERDDEVAEPNVISFAKRKPGRPARGQAG